MPTTISPIQSVYTAPVVQGNSPNKTTDPTSAVETQKEDKEKKAKTLPPEEPRISGGLGMRAVWESQAGRREEEQAARAAARAKMRTMPATPQVATDGSEAAKQLMQDAAREAAANREAQAKAAEARRAEQARQAEKDPFAPEEPANPFAPKADAEDPLAAEPSAPRVSPGFSAYQGGEYGAAEPGSVVDGRV